MRSPVAVFFTLFFLLSQLIVALYTSSPSSPFSSTDHVNECHALLQFSSSLKIPSSRVVPQYYCGEYAYNFTTYPKTRSWKQETDCCSWDGVICDNVTSNVIELHLRCSLLQGTLNPNSTLFSLQSLQYLDLRGNDFTGYIIPTSICQMRSLRFLYIDDARLGGSIPQCIGNLSKLEMLGLSYNRLEGLLPESLSNCTRLVSLKLGYNEIEGTFPHWLKTLPLMVLGLRGNQFHGSISEPTIMTLPFPYLKKFLIAENNFGGRLPTEYFLRSNLTVMGLSGNMFDGDLPLPPPTASGYFIVNNYFSGKISSFLCNATKLEVIDLSYNGFTGIIPVCFTHSYPNLLGLYLEWNMLRGPIPEISAGNNSLKSFNLRGNQFGGKPPQFLKNCKNLALLDLGYNEMEGEFPDWLKTLPSLEVLLLNNNKFQGPMKCSSNGTQHFPKLHILDLSNNQFRGNFPTGFISNLRAMMGGENRYRRFEYETDDLVTQEFIVVTLKGVNVTLPVQTAFTMIDLSCNFFQGGIPESIGKLKSLMVLNFSKNDLTGSIPSSTGDLTSLEVLDLSFNKLNGEIPRALADLKFLSYLNLSMNQLGGPIPESTQLSTFNSDSFYGNPGLCGHPLKVVTNHHHGRQLTHLIEKKKVTKMESGLNGRLYQSVMPVASYLESLLDTFY